MENWKLQNAGDTEFRPDTSGIYCLINWLVDQDAVRLDIMSKADEPLQSFVGDADNVRKHAMRWIHEKSPIQISLEHAAYIGSELEKADTMRINYVQDAK